MSMNRHTRLARQLSRLCNHTDPKAKSYWPVAAYRIERLSTWPDVTGPIEQMTVERIREHPTHDFAAWTLRFMADYASVFALEKEAARDIAFTARVVGKEWPIVCLPNRRSHQFDSSIVFNPGYTELEEPQEFSIRSPVYGHVPVTELRSNRILVWGRDWYGDPVVGECRDVLAHTAQVAIDSINGVHRADALTGLKRDVLARAARKHAGERYIQWTWWRHIGPCEDCFQLFNPDIPRQEEDCTTYPERQLDEQ